MSPHGAVVLAALAPAAVLGGLRWTRVAQREHYLAGSTSRFALRWWFASPVAAGLTALAVAGTVATVFSSWAGLAVAAIVATGPPGLSVRGRTSRLVWTRRCRLVAGVALGIAVLGSALSGAFAGQGAAVIAASASVLILPAVLDVALALLKPFEDALAERHVATARRRLERAKPVVVGITGSYGKTTTKNYLAHLLAARFSVVASPKSYNNRAGLSRTVNELVVPGTDVLIAEMGTYGPGEIAALCSWLEPRVAVLTAIGPVHLERFRSLERTLAAKSEIAARAATVVCNVDDERLSNLSDRLASEGRAVVRCSAGGRGLPAADVAVLACDDGEDAHEVVLEIAGARIGAARLPESTAPGTLTNVSCALGAALSLGCTPDELLTRLSSLPGTGNRLEAAVSETGLVVLDDTFNSNPSGARVALDELSRRGATARRRVVVTPGMVELGPVQASENEIFARDASHVATDLVVVGRTNRRPLVRGGSTGSTSVVWVPTRDASVSWVRAQLGPGDVVLYENDLPDHYP